MEQRHKALLRAKRLEITSDLRFRDIRRHLLDNGILNGTDLDEIENEERREDQAKALLDILPTRGTNAFMVFRDALKDRYPHLARILQDEGRHNLHTDSGIKEPRVFIIHAGEDKESFVRPLVANLQQQGLAEKDIFFDDVSIKPGDVIRDRILSTLSSQSLELAVIVVSTSFLNKPYWPKLEFETCLSNKKRIFPIWVNSNDDNFKVFSKLVGEYSPTLKQMSAKRVQEGDVADELPNIATEVVQRLSTLKSVVPEPTDGDATSQANRGIRALGLPGKMAQAPNSLRERVKLRLAHMPEDDFNVLVVGMSGAGKSSFINSMIMAVTGTWQEVAHYSESGHRVTTCLERIVMFDDDCHERDEPHPIPGYKKNVVFWDCAGFPDATEDAYSTIVSLTLDGRIPSGTKVIDCMNQTPDQLTRRFRRVDRNITFDRIVFILSASTNVPNKLVEGIKLGAQQGHDVPIMVVVTKIDQCPNPPDMQERVVGAQAAFDLTGSHVRFKVTSLYCEQLTPWPTPGDYRVMMPNEDIDRNLLNIWMSLTDPNIKAKPAPKAEPAPKDPQPMCVLS